MKRLLKLILKPFWKLTGPVRRPWLRKLDAFLTRVVVHRIVLQIAHQLTRPDGPLAGLAAASERIEAQLSAGRQVAEARSAEADLLLDGLVRELSRLQMQVEELRRLLAEQPEGHTADLFVVGAPIEDDRPAGGDAEPADGRVKAG